jgi:hypothetical protein
MKMERVSTREMPVTLLIEVVSYFRTLNSSSYCSENFKSHAFGFYTWSETVVCSTLEKDLLFDVKCDLRAYVLYRGHQPKLSLALQQIGRFSAKHPTYNERKAMTEIVPSFS